MFLDKTANESVHSADRAVTGNESSFAPGSASSLADGGSSSITSDGGAGGGMQNIFGDINTGVVIGVVAVALIITIVLFVTIVKKKKAPKQRKKQKMIPQKGKPERKAALPKRPEQYPLRRKQRRLLTVSAFLSTTGTISTPVTSRLSQKRNSWTSWTAA